MEFLNFPKTRVKLPNEYIKIYDKHYLENREGLTKVSNFTSKIESWMHKKVAHSSNENAVTLEIGAGTLNQLPYEKSCIYDIVEPYLGLYENSPHLSKVRRTFNDVMEITGKDEGYDRIISIATFEHILNLPDIVAYSCKLLNPNGVMSVAIPNEGRFLWKFAYTISTGLEFKMRYGLDYRKLMNYEHCNNADEIEEILRFFYNDVKVRFFGISRTFSLYRHFECRIPNFENLNLYLEGKKMLF